MQTRTCSLKQGPYSLKQGHTVETRHAVEARDMQSELGIQAETGMQSMMETRTCKV